MSKIRKLGFLWLIVCLLLVPNSAVVLAQDGAPHSPGDGEHQLMLPQIATGITGGQGEAATMEYAVPLQEQQAALRAFSSYEQRAAAKPQPMPVISEAEMAAAAALPTVQGAPGSSPAGMPAAEANAIAQQENAEEWSRIEEQQLQEAVAELQSAEAAAEPMAVDGTRGVFSSFLTNYYSQMHQYFPYRTVGKLYISGGGYCSASVISGLNILVTAAHCVYDYANSRWYPGWTFVPADRAGSAPYGVWTAHHARILTNYATYGSIRYDVALVRLNNRWINSAWRPVSYYTGYMGRSWNYGYTQHMHAQGYPSNLNSGSYTWTCAAESFYYSSDVLGMGCNMTYGSSGGPWVRIFAPYRSGAYNYVNAVVSGVPAGEPIGVTFFGPRFSSSNIVILCTDEGC